MEKVNKDGKTLKEFLADYNMEDFARPSLTTDVVLFSIIEERPAVLLIKRGNHPFIGDWAFPGGFVGEDESCEEAAVRELSEETGIWGLEIEQLVTVSTPARDPRGRTVGVFFMAVTENPIDVSGFDDADAADWFFIDYVATGDDYTLVLKNRAEDIVLRAEINITRLSSGAIDLNGSTVTNSEGIAFDHPKLILYAIEKL